MEIWNVRNIYINSREGRRTWCVENRCNTPYRNRGGIAHTLTCRDGALCVQHCNLIIEVEKLEDIKQLGKLEEGSSQRRIVYDSEYSSPTLQAAMGAGGGNVPLTIEKKKIEAVIGSAQANAMVGTGEYSPSLTSAMGMGGGQIPMVVESEKGPSVKELGFIDKGTGKHQSNTVYDKDGLSPCVCAVFGDKQPPTMFVEQNKVVVDEPKKIKIRQATKQGFIECEIGGVCCLEYPTSTLRRARTIENGQVSPTITTENIPNRIELGNPDFYNFLYEIDGEIYLIRIRKLIPLECWRLMGFTDEDFKKAEKVNSNTQLYKQAGNSIVCDCLEAIFSQMNIQGVIPWNEKRESIYPDQ